jgi:hypothetical protein
MPPLVGNPLLDALDETETADRDELIARYGFAVPTDEALSAVARASPDGVVELGAGTGYWARQLHDRGVRVSAFDRHPPPSTANQWFAGQIPWFPIQCGDEAVITAYPDRTLLIVWPTRDECWAADAIELYHQIGGQRVVYVGEGPGGRTGDDRFHALVGAYGRCLACDYGVLDAACVCGIRPLWRPRTTIDLPDWHGYETKLTIYEKS